MKEYYYIDFIDLDIYSWEDEGNNVDKANKLIGNSFKTIHEAKDALQKILKKRSI